MKSTFPGFLQNQFREGAPRLYKFLYRQFGPPHRARKRQARYAKVRTLVARRCGHVVQGGPFKGMAYSLAVLGAGALAPKLLGCYEEEIQGHVEQLLQKHPKTVLNVGSGEGYYAVGCCLRLPQARCFAYDTAKEARSECEIQSALNGVTSRIVINGFCGPEALPALPLQRALVVSDCEGFEVDLFTDETMRYFSSSDLIIELHDFLRPGASELITGRFAASHQLSIVRTRPRTRSDFAQLAGLRPEDAALALTESRPCPMAWAIMTPKL
jgi:hypothetical protein